MVLTRTAAAQTDSAEWASTRPGAQCTVRLEGGRRVNALVDRDYYASLTLTSPWGGCTGGSSRTTSSGAGAPPDFDSAEDPARRAAVQGIDRMDHGAEGEPDAWQGGEGLSDDVEDDPETWPAGHWHDGDPAPDSPSVSAPLAKASEGTLPDGTEPTLVYVVSPKLARAVAKASLLAAGYRALGTTLEAAATRARWSAALPDVRLRAARAIDETARIDYTGEVIGDTRLTGRADIRLEAALTWRLSELVFSGREPALARIQLTFLRQRQEVVRSALQLLFRWQRAQNLLADPAALPEEQAEALLVSVEAEVQLAVLTDGWFSAERVMGAPWMVARAVDQPRQAPTRLARPVVPRGSPRSPQRPRAQKNRGPAHDAPAPATAPGPIAPGEPTAPGVNEPRDAF